MKKKEFKVGEEVQFGFIRLRVEENRGMMCHRCLFNNFECRVDDLIERSVGSCLASRRSDGKCVVFVEM